MSDTHFSLQEAREELANRLIEGGESKDDQFKGMLLFELAAIANGVDEIEERLEEIGSVDQLLIVLRDLVTVVAQLSGKSS